MPTRSTGQVEKPRATEWPRWQARPMAFRRSVSGPGLDAAADSLGGALNCSAGVADLSWPRTSRIGSARISYQSNTQNAMRSNGTASASPSAFDPVRVNRFLKKTERRIRARTRIQCRAAAKHEDSPRLDEQRPHLDEQSVGLHQHSPGPEPPDFFWPFIGRDAAIRQFDAPRVCNCRQALCAWQVNCRRCAARVEPRTDKSSQNRGGSDY